MNGTSHPVIGCRGYVIVATRGKDGPGEVSISYRGGSEAYIAWSEEPLARGTEVVVWSSRGQRTVDVMPNPVGTPEL